MIDLYSPTPYLHLEKRIKILRIPPPSREEVIKTLEKIKGIPANYPPDLLKARRDQYISQIAEIKTFGPNRPSAKGLIGRAEQASE
jgi:hypothetical protein